MPDYMNFATRDAAKAWLEDGGVLADGASFVAEGDIYAWKTGAAWIPDMPNVVPATVPSPRHFGYFPDLDWRLLREGDLDGENTEAYGPYRDGGRNALNGFLLADRYARMAGIGVAQAVGDYFVKSYARRTTDGVRDSWEFDFFVEDASDIKVSVYKADIYNALPDDHGLAGSAIAEMVHEEVAASDYTVTLNPGGLGGTVHYKPAAGRRIDLCRQFDCRAAWTHRGALWTSYQTFQIGLNLAQSHASWVGDRIIGQYSYFGSKPSNRGEVGVLAGASTGYYTPFDQPKRSGVHLRALCCRAAYIRGDDNDPYVDSDGSILTGAFGWIDRPLFEVGTFGRTNVKSNMLFLAHWGGRYVPPDGPELLDKTSYPLRVTWHPENVKVTFLTEIDRVAHGCYKGWELAAVAGAEVSGAVHRGVSHPFWIGAGDVSDAFVCAEQKGRVNVRKIRIGDQRAIGIAPDPASEYYGVLIKGTGTSKFEVYSGTDIFVQRHGTFDVEIAGLDIEAVAGTREVIRMRQFRGHVDFGDCRLKGADKAIYALGGDGTWRMRMHDCDGLIHVQTHKGGRLEGAAFGGPHTRSGSDPAEAGPDAGDCVVFADGRIITAVTNAPASQGDTVLPINPLTHWADDINQGDAIEVRTPEGRRFKVVSDGLYPNGVLQIGVSALPMDMPSGSVLTVDQSALVDVDRSDTSERPLRLHARTGWIRDGTPSPVRTTEHAYVTGVGEALDLHCRREYGARSGVAEVVLQANPHIRKVAHALPAGVRIALPDVASDPGTSGVRLWD